MRPEKEKCYDAEVYDFEDIMILVLESFLGMRDLLALSWMNKFYNERFPEISRLLLLD